MLVPCTPEEGFGLNTEDDQLEKCEGNSDDLLQGILFEASPYQNVNAVVQHDHRAVYFYLSGDEHFGTRACWIRNLIEAPYVINQADLDAGRPPVMPRTHCRYPAGGEVPDPESLEVVWFEEGNAAALFESNRLIAVIPPWSGVDGFHGYSAECVAESPIAWPMMDSPSLLNRIDRAKEFWESCCAEENHPFATLQPRLLPLYRAWFGPQENYYSLDAGQFPPRGAALYTGPDARTLVSVGMSLRPQPNVEMFVEHPRECRRIELAISLPPSTDGNQLQPLLEQFSGLVAWPWNGFTWFGEGHRCELPSLPPILGPDYGTVRFTEHTKIKPASEIRMPAFRDDPIRLLWLSPSSEKENANM